MASLRVAAACVLLFVLAGAAAADVVVTTDGSRYEGDIISENDTSVRIDTVVGSIRATLTLGRSGIKDIERKPLPADFFAPPPVEARVSKSSSFEPGDAVYLEVPIRGKFGHNVFADGIKAVLAYAIRYRIRHVVFVIDSEGFNDIDEASAVFRALQNGHPSLQYHALVTNCTGDALAVAMVCDTINLAPNGRIGGAPEKLSDASKRINVDQEAIIRRQIANNAAQMMRDRGKPGLLIQAMIDNEVELAAWLDDSGKVMFGMTPPDGINPDKVFFHKKPGEVLVLTSEQIAKAGGKPVDGGAAALGPLLGFESWKLESDYGLTAMTKAAAAGRSRLEAADAAKARRIQQNITRRQTVNEALQHAVQEAAKWDPSNASYATYASNWHWGWGWGRECDGGSDSTIYTQQSRRKWQERTDISMKYLKDAAKAALAMEDLDKEAVELGLDPTYKPGQLAQFKTDLEVKYDNLSQNRNKRGE